MAFKIVPNCKSTSYLVIRKFKWKINVKINLSNRFLLLRHMDRVSFILLDFKSCFISIPLDIWTNSRIERDLLNLCSCSMWNNCATLWWEKSSSCYKMCAFPLLMACLTLDKLFKFPTVSRLTCGTKDCYLLQFVTMW